MKIKIQIQYSHKKFKIGDLVKPKNACAGRSLYQWKQGVVKKAWDNVYESTGFQFVLVDTELGEREATASCIEHLNKKKSSIFDLFKIITK